MYRSKPLLALTAIMLISTALLAPLSAPTMPVAAQAATVVYNLYATDGYAFLADGTRIYIYGFIGGRQGQAISYIDNGGVLRTATVDATPTTGAALSPTEAAFQGNAQLPAPVIYAKVGDIVEIRLKNLGVVNPFAPNDPHTIHLHGLDVDAANDGVPETSVAAVAANGPGPGAGNVVVYMFAPTVAGTYMYHCHQEASIHVQMGMYGALVVYNATDAAAATGPGAGMGGTLHGFTYNKDYIMMLTEIDTGQHLSEETIGGPAPFLFNPVLYKPQYWLVNGLSFPNTVHVNTINAVNWLQWIQAHPGYDPFITGRGLGSSNPTGDKVLVRVINLGFQTQPMHVHGFHPKIIGADQRAWDWSNTAATAWGAGLEHNTILVGSGQTYELLFNFGQQSLNSTYPTNTSAVMPSLFVGGTQSKYDPLSGAPLSNATTVVGALPIPDPFTPPFDYLGGPLVTGLVGHPDPVSQYFPFHNHDDYKATNNGIYPGGAFTMLRMDP